MTKYKRLQKPIIFIGTGRSGTTIISEIISRHQDLAFVSNYNNKFPKNTYINLVRLLFDNPLYTVSGQKRQLNKVSVFNRYLFKPAESYAMWKYVTGDEVDFSRDFLIDREISDERIEFIRSYFDKMVRFQNKKRLVFKITGPPRIAFLAKIFPDAIFIHLKRKYIPTIASFLKVDFWKTRGIDKLWWEGAYDDKDRAWVSDHAGNGALVTAFQLKRINDIAQYEVDKLRPSYMEVHYEDFVANPGREIKRIVAFADLAPFDTDKILQNISVHNRNKKDTEYFSDMQLKEIYDVLETK